MLCWPMTLACTTVSSSRPMVCADSAGGAGAAEPEQFQCLVDLRRQGVAFQAESWQQVGKVSAFDIQQFKQQVFDFDVVMAPLQAALRGALQRVFALAVEACDQAAKLHQTISAWRR
ncbi:hypothetical protein KPSA3_03536 [Pseudomonas syringae pv. actinidiae]|uniref:Uncharacterized protein n=1 Tax=Pseudomonas syringae pv. actinidiae TaxID=103796 RepID=A0AAN4TLB4_PSESF|nr:hypothetical protein KPSA3_03536 [Pseudomonas syringae pv. actinidiae]